MPKYEIVLLDNNGQKTTELTIEESVNLMAILRYKGEMLKQISINGNANIMGVKWGMYYPVITIIIKYLNYQIITSIESIKVNTL